ncbi:cytochrome c oxidase subunit 8B, mitochondrial-like [Seriola lalandi dorsalis]|uniref:Cytochrome c oxidase subunit 8B, mitochondrial-like n=1 Tax=Seriola lalandi dorsalis TaxID=1841481 RepID=A0A3B4WGR2_SERLL|nr:cytochrome c oxidase subunit 8B, mitochondrial-like [Seriola lalandi dorsalis]XP_056243765.1 cytochrome c oxidase subunit 8B, mitochondrial [Seriola aureovittata]
MSLLTVSRLFRSALRTQLVSAAHLSSKPAKHNVTAGEQAIAMTVLMMTILGPSGWILAHLEDYKKK